MDGPLLEAMREGGFLYIEEFNRAPEDTLNTLLTAMAERQVAVPRAGTVTAKPTFRVIASMNPYDNVGTTRLSTSVHDRLCRLAITYQDAESERGIVALRAPLPDLDPGLYTRLVADAVAVTRATREHPDVRQGSSVRGAIDTTLIAGQLLDLRGIVVALRRRRELPGRGVRRDGGRAVRADLPRRDRGGHPRGRAPADLGGPLHPEPGRGGAWLKSSRGRLPPDPAGRAAAQPAPGVAAAPAAPPPKVLDEPPVLMEPARGGTGGLVLSGGGRGGRRPPRSGSGGPAITEEQGTLISAGDAAADGGVQADPETLRRARQIAAQLAVPRPRRDTSARRGVGELASVRYNGGSDDIDLDRTVEQLVEHPVPEEDDIIVRERVRTRRSVVLLVDVSGSMRGERIRTAAATVGALAAELDRDDLSVVAFWSDAAVLSHLGQHVPAQQLLEEMLRIPAKGLTNIAFPLQVAATELARVPARDARVVLLSDCVHNAGPDPRPLAARLSRLDVLLDTSGEQDAELARDLARVGRGRLLRIRAYTDVAPALGVVFAS